MFEISHYSVCHGSYHRLYLNDKWSQPGHALSPFWWCVRSGMEMMLGEPNLKQQKVEQRWEEKSGEEGRFQWGTLSESQGNSFEQRSAGSALTFLVEKKKSIWKAAKSPERQQCAFAARSNRLLPCLDYAAGLFPHPTAPLWAIHLVTLLQMASYCLLARPGVCADVGFKIKKSLQQNKKNPKSKVKPSPLLC